MSSETLISEDMIAAYQRDGVVLVPGLLRDRVAQLAEAVAANMARPSEV